MITNRSELRYTKAAASRTHSQHSFVYNYNSMGHMTTITATSIGMNADATIDSYINSNVNVSLRSL